MAKIANYQKQKHIYNDQRGDVTIWHYTAPIELHDLLDSDSILVPNFGKY